MRGFGQRGQLILFLVAVLVPCAALVALSVRIVNQDRELRTKRQGDEQQRMVDAAGVQLASALESIRADEVRTDLEPGQHYRHAETVFVAWAEGDRLVLPWEAERDQAARRCRELIAEPQFAAAVRACDLGRNADCYKQAGAAATHPIQATYARWLWAQALDNAGQSQAAAAIYRNLLEAGPEVTDDDGIPVKLHAAQVLAAQGSGAGHLAAGVDSLLSLRPWLSPLSSFLVQNIAERLARGAVTDADKQAAEHLRRRAEAQVRILEQAEALQRDFVRIRGLFQNRAWAAYGDDLWLLGEAADAGTTVFVVSGQDVFHRLALPASSRLADSRETGGRSLGSAFPGLRLVMGSTLPALPDAGGDVRRQWFYVLMVLAVAVTMFGAYLLWRDLKREVRTTELRAQFVSSVTHELKTPLTSIRMYAETLQLGRYRDEETQLEYLGTIVNECERLSRLVDDVLQFAKNEQGKRTYRLVSMNPADAVHAAARAVEYAVSLRGYRLQVSVAHDLPRIRGDRDALEQAVLNLLSNALKFSGDSRDIELDLYCKDGEVITRVTDHGLGIAPEEQSRIFEKFYRVPSRENQLISGTGLGLALVSQIMKAHGGQVEVESELGKGSTFYLRLPAEPERNGQEA